MDYVKISRKILEWEWYTDANTKVLFLHILLKANWKDGRFQGIEVPRGSFVTSLQNLAAETGLTVRNVRTALKHLENTGEELLTERIKNLRKKGELPACYDLLKVGHHGSRNATGEELLEVIRPRAAFCSSGKENRYGHPHAETLERLAKWGVSLYNTKDRGAVSMYTDGREYGIQSP